MLNARPDESVRTGETPNAPIALGVSRLNYIC
jgi:hypothetical protein